MDYTEFTTALQTMLVVQDASGIANLNAILPRIIEYAEKRIYRELDFLATRTRDATQLTTPGDRHASIPSSLLVIEGATLILPASANANTSGAQRVTMLRTSRGFIDTIWPVETLTQTPQLFQTYYAIFSEEEETGEGAQIPNAIIIAPTPDNTYHVEYTGTFRPNPLSSTNPNTVLTDLFPDLFLAAAMIFASGYQRDFGAQTSDPQMAQSWETQYRALREGATAEEWRKKAQAANTGPMLPSPFHQGAAAPAPAPRPPVLAE